MSFWYAATELSLTVNTPESSLFLLSNTPVNLLYPPVNALSLASWATTLPSALTAPSSMRIPFPAVSVAGSSLSLATTLSSTLTTLPSIRMPSPAVRVLDVLSTFPLSRLGLRYIYMWIQRGAE